MQNPKALVQASYGMVEATHDDERECYIIGFELVRVTSVAITPRVLVSEGLFAPTRISRGLSQLSQF